VYERTRDAGLLAYALDAAADAGVSLAVRDAVLRFLLPLFPPPGAAAGPAAGMHAHALTRLLVTLADPAAASPLLRGLVEKDKLLAYQFAFDLVEGGAQDFLETVRNDLPQDGVRSLRAL
jgi:26S proteasome regulatory subunit N2